MTRPNVTGPGLAAAPDSTNRFDHHDPKLDGASFEAIETSTTGVPSSRCGDPVAIAATLNGVGYLGTVTGTLKTVADGTAVQWQGLDGNPTSAVTAEADGNQVVELALLAKKADDTWSDAADVTATVEFKTPDGTAHGSVTTSPGLRIFRPDNGTLARCVPTGEVRTTRWVEGAGAHRGRWVRAPELEPWHWPANYELNFSDGVITLTCRYKLVPRPRSEVVPADSTTIPNARALAALPAPTITPDKIQQWKQAIETAWNDWFKLHRAGCLRGDSCDCTFKCCKPELKFQVEFVESGEHFEVKLYEGEAAGHWGEDDWWYSDQWYTEDMTNHARVHEFGHGLGLYDDYVGGATDPAVDLSQERVVKDRAGNITPQSLPGLLFSIMSKSEQVFEHHMKRIMAPVEAFNRERYNLLPIADAYMNHALNDTPTNAAYGVAPTPRSTPEELAEGDRMAAEAERSGGHGGGSHGGRRR